MKLSDRDLSAWHKLGFVLTALTVVLAGGLVIESSELAMDGWAIIGWQFICVIPLLGGTVAYLARRLWLHLTRNSVEPEAHILLPPLAVIAIAAMLAYSGWTYDARFALSRGAFERAVDLGATFESHGSERWIGLYKIRGVHIDALGRSTFNLGDCSMFAHCELEFDATTPCESRGWSSYRALDPHWCVVIHDHL
jgi:hypothetical protein